MVCATANQNKQRKKTFWIARKTKVSGRWGIADNLKLITEITQKIVK